MIELSKEEEKAIAALERVAKIWPDTLWLFSGDGSLYVMKKDNIGRHAIKSHGGVDDAFIVDEILGIDNDGGDW